MASDDIQHLHQFAAGLGIPRSKFHNRRGRNKPHYDVPESHFADAMKAGARWVHSRDIVKLLQLTPLLDTLLKSAPPALTDQPEKCEFLISPVLYDDKWGLKVYKNLSLTMAKPSFPKGRISFGAKVTLTL